MNSQNEHSCWCLQQQILQSSFRIFLIIILYSSKVVGGVLPREGEEKGAYMRISPGHPFSLIWPCWWIHDGFTKYYTLRHYTWKDALSRKGSLAWMLCRFTSCCTIVKMITLWRKFCATDRLRKLVMAIEVTAVYTTHEKKWHTRKLGPKTKRRTKVGSSINVFANLKLHID